MNRRAFLSMMIPALALSACRPSRKPPLRLGTYPMPGFEPLFAARDTGALPEAAVLLTEYPSAAEVVLAFRNGGLDAATLSVDEAMRLVELGESLRGVLVLNYSEGADALVAREGIADVMALRGLKVGVEANNVGAFVLVQALAKNGMTPRDVNLVSHRPDRLEGEFLRGRVDAMVTYDPYLARVLERGARVIFDSADIPGSVVRVVVARMDAMEVHADNLRLMAEAWFSMSEKVQENPALITERAQKRLGLTAGQFTHALKRVRFKDRAENLRLLNPGDALVAGRMEKFADFMQENGLLDSELNLSLVRDDRFVKEGGK